MEINPWNVESIEAFSYFKCPECSFLSQVKKYFEDHAVKNHLLSTVLFGKAIENLNDGSDEMIPPECESMIVKGTPKSLNEIGIDDSNDSFAEEGFEDHMKKDRKIRVPIIKTEECEPEMIIDGFSQVTNRNSNDDYNENCEEVQANSDPLTLTNLVQSKSIVDGNLLKDCFEDISKRSRSRVWAHFLKNRKDSLARCMYCSAILNACSTSSLHTHLTAKHSINLLKCDGQSQNSLYESMTRSEDEFCENDKEPKSVYKTLDAMDKMIEVGAQSESVECNEKDRFKNISDKSKSKVWDHFLLSKNECLAKCMHCSVLLKGSGYFGTKSLHNHLTLKHSISLLKCDVQSQNSFYESMTRSDDDFCENDKESKSVYKTSDAKDKMIGVKAQLQIVECNEKDRFKNISDKSKSKVWDHFLLSKNECLAKCMHCSVLLKGSPFFGTNSLRRHLRDQHSIALPKVKLSTKSRGSFNFEEKSQSSNNPKSDDFDDKFEDESTTCNEIFDNFSDINEESFEDISDGKFKVWNHFLLNKIDSQAKCVYCSALLKVSKGSTKSLHDHLFTKHSIQAEIQNQLATSNIDKVKSNVDYVDDLSNECQFGEETDQSKITYPTNTGEKHGFEDISVRSKSKVWDHFLFNRIDSRAKCNYCSAVFKALGSIGTKSLHGHLTRKHSIKVPKLNEKSIECSNELQRNNHDFQKNSPSKEDCKIQEGENHEEKPFGCNDCHFRSKKKEKMIRHVLSMHQGKVFHKCSICDMCFSSKENLQMHSSSVHEEKKKSKDEKDGFEDISARRKSKVWGHFLLNRIDSLAKCNYCSTLFKVSGSMGTKSLHNHLTRKHSIEVPKLNEKSIDSSDELQINNYDFQENSPSKEDCKIQERRPYKYCGKDYTGDLKDHIISVHKGKKTYMCDVCGTCFDDKRCLHKHIKMVHEEKKSKQSYKCSKCDAVFLGSKTFAQHVIKNHGERGFKDISEKSRSKVWEHFLLNRTDSKAKCLYCSIIYKVTGGSTKTLHNHIKSKHSIVVSKLNELKEPSNNHFDNNEIFQSQNVNSLDEVPFQSGISPALPKW